MQLQLQHFFYFFVTFLVICHLLFGKKNYCHGEIHTWQLLGNGIEWSIVSAELRDATLNDSLLHLAFITIGYSYSFAQITKIMNEFFKSSTVIFSNRTMHTHTCHCWELVKGHPSHIRNIEYHRIIESTSVFHLHSSVIYSTKRWFLRIAKPFFIFRLFTIQVKHFSLAIFVKFVENPSILRWLFDFIYRNYAK